MRKFLLAVLVIGCTACTKPESTEKSLQDAGFTNVTITGYRFFKCGEDDTFHTGFKATGPTGRPVTGVVCSGFLKGNTIRLD